MLTPFRPTPSPSFPLPLFSSAHPITLSLTSMRPMPSPSPSLLSPHSSCCIRYFRFAFAGDTQHIRTHQLSVFNNNAWLHASQKPKGKRVSIENKIFIKKQTRIGVGVSDSQSLGDRILEFSTPQVIAPRCIAQTPLQHPPAMHILYLHSFRLQAMSRP